MQCSRAELRDSAVLGVDDEAWRLLGVNWLGSHVDFLVSRLGCVVWVDWVWCFEVVVCALYVASLCIDEIVQRAHLSTLIRSLKCTIQISKQY